MEKRRGSGLLLVKPGQISQEEEVTQGFQYSRGQLDDPGILTNYGEFLDLYPPERFAEIKEDTSWSCAHGVERWRADCGCRVGSSPDSSQSWRRPLRAALDWLRDGFVPLFEQEASLYFRDPWEARNAYIDVLLDRGLESQGNFFARQGLAGLNEDKRRRSLEILEMQNHLLAMFTSCGWFFDDPFGLETAIVLKQAARALEWGRSLFGVDRQKEFLDRLEECRNNFPDRGKESTPNALT